MRNKTERTDGRWEIHINFFIQNRVHAPRANRVGVWGRSTCDRRVARLLLYAMSAYISSVSPFKTISYSSFHFLFLSSPFHFSDKFKAAGKLILPDYSAVILFLFYFFNSFQKNIRI